ncbi:hypothetical protein WR25_09633 [Diploscapter pachys]|uniref:Uncharacterized protein n=1 Tax=Diploscapter pachys TaxID=2018661 RepID=A0A2A2J5C6_9BILA|nr:hypothetical protein WR25_09633 [Diploscapter pachys]
MRAMDRSGLPNYSPKTNNFSTLLIVGISVTIATLSVPIYCCMKTTPVNDVRANRIHDPFSWNYTNQNFYFDVNKHANFNKHVDFDNN